MEYNEDNLYEYDIKINKLNKRKIVLFIVLPILGIIILVSLLCFFSINHSKNDEIETSANTYQIENNEEMMKKEEIPIIEEIDLEQEKDLKIEEENIIQTEPNFDINAIDQTGNILEGYEDCNEYTFVKSKVHVREQDNTESTIKATLEETTKILRIGKNQNGWSKVVFNNGIGYISSEFLTTDELKEPPHNDFILKYNESHQIDQLRPMVALTFDDGPYPESTNRILDVLEKYNVVATFFDLGIYMELYPDVTKREEKIGCEVGTHTYSHKNLNILTKETIKEELEKAREVYIKTLGHDFQLVRPPYGNANTIVRTEIQNPLINWDIDTLDWKNKDSEKIMAQIRRYSNLDGSIILMHSIYDSTADAIDILVPELLEKGYQFVTISEMVHYKGLTLQTGNIYLNFK